MATQVSTIAQSVQSLRQVFKAASFETAALDARVLVGHVCGLSREDMIVHDTDELTALQVGELKALAARRLNHEPIAYLVGQQEFFGLAFQVCKDVLIPRPDTEVLVETANAFGSKLSRPLKVLDLGTGSGAILLSILHEVQGATGLGIDRSPTALAVAKANAQRHGLSGRAEFAQGNWAGGVEETFDLVVSNPPYITSSDMKGLMRGVIEFEPESALVGGVDGLDPLRLIAADLPRLLVPGGLFLAEIGIGQDEEARAILHKAGLNTLDTVPDLNGIPRCVVASSGEIQKTVENLGNRV